jgi:hypothetical protein
MGYTVRRRSAIAEEDNIFFIFSTSSNPAPAPTHLRASGVKRPECEADYSLPSSTQIKHGGAIYLHPKRHNDVVLNYLSIRRRLLYNWLKQRRESRFEFVPEVIPFPCEVGPLVTTVRRVLGLRMEGRPPAMEGSCECTE